MVPNSIHLDRWGLREMPVLRGMLILRPSFERMVVMEQSQMLLY